MATRPAHPGCMLVLEAQDAALDLDGKPVGLAIGAPRTVIQTVQATFLVAIVDLVAGDPRYAELTAKGRHLIPFKQPGNEFETFVHWLTLFPRHSGSPKCEMCKPCDRYKMSAISR